MQDYDYQYQPRYEQPGYPPRQQQHQVPVHHHGQTQSFAHTAGDRTAAIVATVVGRGLSITGKSILFGWYFWTLPFRISCKIGLYMWLRLVAQPADYAQREVFGQELLSLESLSHRILSIIRPIWFKIFPFSKTDANAGATGPRPVPPTVRMDSPATPYNYSPNYPEDSMRFVEQREGDFHAGYGRQQQRVRQRRVAEQQHQPQDFDDNPLRPEHIRRPEARQTMPQQQGGAPTTSRIPTTGRKGDIHDEDDDIEDFDDLDPRGGDEFDFTREFGRGRDDLDSQDSYDTEPSVRLPRAAMQASAADVDKAVMLAIEAKQTHNVVEKLFWVAVMLMTIIGIVLVRIDFTRKWGGTKIGNVEPAMGFEGVYGVLVVLTIAFRADFPFNLGVLMLVVFFSGVVFGTIIARSAFSVRASGGE